MMRNKQAMKQFKSAKEVFRINLPQHHLIVACANLSLHGKPLPLHAYLSESSPLYQLPA